MNHNHKSLSISIISKSSFIGTYITQASYLNMQSLFLLTFSSPSGEHEVILTE